MPPWHGLDGPTRELGPESATALEGEASLPPSPILGEVEAVFGERDRRLERLAREYEASSGFEPRLLLEREMANVKRRAVLEMFRIQRRYALERDDTATVELMDASIRRIEHRMAKGAMLPPEDVPTHEAASEKEVRP
jgi:hypothetical protein